MQFRQNGVNHGIVKNMVINDVEINAELSDIISELQEQLRINEIDLLQRVKDSGDNIMVQCPYHGDGHERKPSAGIHKETGVFHCFACGETHSLPEVISHCFGHTNDLVGSYGWKWILRNFATVQVEERKDVHLDFGRRTSSGKFRSGSDSIHSTVSDISSERNFVTEEELDSYRYIHPYMYKRKLTDEIIEAFDIGYDNNTDCITFPVRDISGRTCFVARRSVRYKYFNYPKGVVKPLYGLYELFRERYLYTNTAGLRYETNDALIKRLSSITRLGFSEVIICESMLDALTCWVYGKYAVALNGLGNELQFQQLRNLPCRKLILATDSDDAGMKARKRIRANVKNKIITEYILPEGKKDINELICEEFNKLEEIF